MFSDEGKGAESSGWSEGIRRYEMTVSYVSCSSTEPSQKALKFPFLRLHVLWKSTSFDQTCYLLSEVFGEFKRHFLECLLLTMLPSD